jgi:outer membrane protein OmpA-like peptidoglycan-associated protein
VELPNNEEYTLVLDVTDPHWKTQEIYLVNRENETIAVLNKDNDFKFYISLQEKSKMKLLKLNNKDIRMDLKGKLAINNNNSPFANAAVSLINDQEQIMQNTVTDKSGNFDFNYLPADTAFYLSIDETSTSKLPKGTTVLLMDDKDNVINRTTSPNAKFILANLPPEYNKLAKIYSEDPWLQAVFGRGPAELLVIENVYFDLAKWDITPASKAILNKTVIAMKKQGKISLEVTAHTDSRGDEKSNLILSEKRALEAKKYIISQGIESKRISAKGMGESRLINQCKNDVPCTEEEHAVNRRMEFKTKSIGK